MKRILYVIGSLDVGGAEMHLYQLLPKLKNRGWNVEVYCISKPGFLAEKLKQQGISVTSPILQTREGSSFFYRLVRVIFSFISLYSYMLFRRIEIVHFFLPKAYLIGGICSILAFKKIKIMSRRSLNLYQSNHPLLSKLEIKLHRYMTAILGNSKAVTSQLINEGVPNTKLGLIYNGVDTLKFNNTKCRDTVRNENGISSDALVFIIVANIIPYKGHKILLQALALIANKIPQPWFLLIVGRDDGIGNELINLSREYNISDSIKLLGPRSDVPDLLKASDIGVLSSLEEGFSNAVLECMAAGLAMVVTDVGGNGEAVLNKITGLVVPPNNPVKLSKALLEVALNTALRLRFSLNSVERVNLHFSIDSCANQYHLFYKNQIEKLLT